MNDLVRIAQVTSGASSPVKVKITKPSDGAAQVIQVAPGMVLDLQGVAAQDVVMVHAGDRLIILFADRSSVVLAGFYGPDGQPIVGLDVDLGRSEPIPATNLAGMLPISNDMSLLPAAGPASSAGNAPSSSLHVNDVTPDDLGDGGRPLDLLAGNDTGAGGGPDGFSELASQGRVNNAATMGGQTAGGVTEDLILSTTGVITVTDSDAGESQVVAQPNAAGLYGTFSVDASGTWVYVLDNANASVQALGAGKSLTESFTVTSLDGTASEIVTVTINGTNDVPEFGGVSEGSVAEDRVLSTAGTLTIVDVDTGESSFIAQTNVAGLYGTFSVDAAGNWTYALDNGNSAVQALGAEHSLTETFDVVSADGSASQTVTVTIDGTNDVPELGGATNGSVKEDTILTATGVLTIADIDTGESNFTAQTGTAGAYGSFSVDADGNWSYVLDNSLSQIQSLGAGDHVTETFTVWSSDHSASETVIVTINGTNDVPVLGGTVNGTVTEDFTFLASGALTIVDVDTGESTFVPQANISGLYGTFSVDAGGNWNYALNNANSAVQSLGANAHLSETFTVWSSDLSASEVVTVTINGTNDAPVIGGNSFGSVKEDNTITANGVLTIVDVDTGESAFVAQSSTAGTYGTFSINAAGAWTYTLANNSTAVQSLGANAHPTETFTVWSADQSRNETITITVNGTNDVPTLFGVTAGPEVIEDTVFSISNNLHITDRDTGESAYEVQTDTVGTYGTFSIDATGHWTYTLNNSSPAVQSLGINNNPTETFKVWSADHSANIDLTVTIRGTNDVPTFGGNIAGAITEDNFPVTVGVLTINDPDSGQSGFTARSNVPGTYGTFSIDNTGAWTYTLNNSLASVQVLGANSHPIETFTVVSSDGSATQTVTITVNGTNDAPAGIDKAITAIEDAAYTFTAADFGFTDAEGNALLGVKITGLPGAGSLTLNGAAITVDQTVSASDIANGSLKFTPAANASGNNYASLKFAIQDDGGTAHGGVDTDQSPNTITLHVAAVNDAPSGANNAIQAFEDTAYVFKAADFGFTDSDGNTLAGVKITQLPGAGTLMLGGSAITLDQIVNANAIASGLLTFIPAANAVGNDYATIQFAVQDNGGTTNGGVDLDQSPNTLTVNVGGINDAPFGIDKTITATEDTAYTFSTGDFNFTDSEGNALAGVKISVLPGTGSLTLNGNAVLANQIVSASDIANGLLQYTPAANSTTSTTFRFNVQDDGGTANGGANLDPSSNIITVNVTPVNDAPVLDPSKNLTMSVNEDSGAPSGAVGAAVSAFVDRIIDGNGPDNFTDPDSFVAGMAIVGQNSSHGTWYVSFNEGVNWSLLGAVSNSNALLLRPEYRLYFKPAADYSGTVEDALTFRAWDINGTPGNHVDTTTGGGSTPYSAATDTISVTVNGTNDAPIAQAKSVPVAEDGTLTGQNVTATDVDGDHLTYSVEGTPPPGLIFNADGTWSYTPPANYQSLDDTEKATVTFQYKANDGSANSNTATVTITINGANDAPVAQDREVSVSEDGSLTGQTVIATDVDVENLTYAIVGIAPQGLIFNTDGTWTYTPPASHQALNNGQSDQVSFQYTANDGTTNSDPATVTITINGANEVLGAQDSAIAVSEDGTLTNQHVSASDGSGTPLVYSVVNGLPDGVVFNNDGTWSYTPPASYQSLDDNEPATVSFQYKANNGIEDSNTATVTITIDGANDAPVARDFDVSVSENGFLVGQPSRVTDVDIETLTYAIVGDTPAGLIYNTVSGSWSYTPPAGYQSLDDNETATVTFRYKVNDGSVDSIPATVTITVTGANDAPVAQNNSVQVSEDAALTGQTVVATDVDGETLTYEQVGTPLAGLTFGTDGTWSYTPPASYQSLPAGQFGTVSFQYHAYDGTAYSNTATQTIVITGRDDAPGAVFDTGDITEDAGTSIFNVRANDTLDPDTNAPNTISVGSIFVTGGASFGIDASDLRVTVTGDNQLQVQLLGTDWNNMWSGAALNVAINYTLLGDQSVSSGNVLSLTVTGINDAPVLVTTASPTMTAIEDAAAPVRGTVGTAVSTLIDRVIDGNGLDNVSDPDSFLAGVALVGQNNSQGTWYYSLDNGNTWTMVGTLSTTSALVLRPENLLYFKPNADYSGTITDGLTFRAWDGSGGNPGSPGNHTEINGGTSPYSTDTDTISVTVTAVNHAATITGISTGAVTENATQTTTAGDLNSIDTDGTNDAWQAVTAATATTGGYGTYTIDSTGHWVYALNNANPAVNGLAASDTLTDTFTAKTADGTSQVVTVTITGANDAPTIAGTTTGSVTEDTSLTSQGVLTISDPDIGQSFFIAQTAKAGTYGSFSIDTSGAWTYTLDNSKTAVQALGSTNHPTETFTVTSADGTTTNVVVTVNGASDAPVLDASKVLTLTTNEDAPVPNGAVGISISNFIDLSGGGGLDNVTDIDTLVTGIAITGVNTAHGLFFVSVPNSSAWAAIPPGSVSDTHALLLTPDFKLYFKPNADYNGTIEDALTFRAWDRTSGISANFADTTVNGGSSAFSAASDTISVTVTPVNDAAVIDGAKIGAITEDATPNTTTGDLNSTDIDGIADAWQTVTTATPTIGGYGTYTIDATGHWVYALNNANTTVNGLAAGATLTDTFTAMTADGTTQVVTVIITGANDAVTSINLDDIAHNVGGFKIIGENASDQAGVSVASAGDINGDGYDDLIVGATSNDAGALNAGAAYVVYGSATRFTTTINLDDIAANHGGFKIIGQNASDSLGIGVASAGDINGDGYDDLIIGAYQNGAGGNNSGAAYVVYGQAAIASFDLDTVPAGTVSFKIVGQSPGDNAGYSVASAGDVNGDGYDDLIVGAFRNNDTDPDLTSGAAYVIYGKAESMGQIDLATIAAGTGGFKIVGDLSGDISADFAGVSVASAGDVNGDGYDDLIIGAMGNSAGGTSAGGAYVVYGREARITSINLTTIAAGNGGFRIIGENAGDVAGESVASAGDVNGDGYADVIVGARNNSTSPTGIGAAYVVYGTAAGITSVDLDNIAAGNGGFKIIGENSTVSTGVSVASAGDVNGDGYDDLLIGANLDDAGADNAGAAYLIYGKAAPFTTIDLDDIVAGHGGFKIIGENAGDQAGISVASAGDINNDGYADLIVGAHQSDGGGANSGAAYVIYGGQNVPNNTSAHIAGTDTGVVKEDVTGTASGVLTATLPDHSAVSFTAETLTGSYGSFRLLANGTWTYTLNNNNSAVHALNEGQHLSDSFKVTSADGTAMDTVTVTINGTTDAVVPINVTEDVTHVFTAADFGQAGSGFESVTIPAPNLSGAGKLMFGNFMLTSTVVVSAEQIAAGALTWVPTDDVLGAAGNSSFDFSVRFGVRVDLPRQTMPIVMSATNYQDFAVQQSSSETGIQLALSGDNRSFSKSGTQSNFINLQAGGAALDGLNFLRSDNNLEISWLTAGNTLHVMTGLNHFDGGNSAMGIVYLNGATFDGYDLGYAPYTIATGPTGSDGVNDIIAGSAANDPMNGLGGNDVLFGNGGVDSINGGDGNDLLVGGLGDDQLNGGAGADIVIGGEGNDIFRFNSASEIVTGDVLDGGAGTDIIQASGGNGFIFNLENATVRDIENFQFFSDFSVTAETLNLTATQWMDLSLISMGAGTDAMRIRVVGDVDISTTSGPVMNGIEQISFIDSSGNDTLTLTGLQFDTLVSSGLLFTQGGSDTLNLTSTSSKLSSDFGFIDNGMTGLETISAEHAVSGVDIALTYQTEAFTLKGSAHDDTLAGGSGNDTINGGNGADFLLGGDGADTLTGGAGADTFAYTATSQGGDTIKDFASNEDLIGIFRDLLGVTDTGRLDADGTTAGGSTVLFESVNGASAAAQNNSTKLIFDTVNHDLYYDADGGASSSARVLLAHLDNTNHLEASSIMLTG